MVVNVSSLCAIQPFNTWGVYCSGKAARNMFHSTLASEQKQQQDGKENEEAAVDQLRVLNYAPGPLDTDMQTEIRQSEGCDKDLHSYFVNSFKEGKLVDPIVSAERLLNLILEEGQFESGDHVDFYDLDEK